MLNVLSMNILLLASLGHMPSYEKFMRDMVTIKRKVIYEPTDNVHHYCVVTSRSLVENKRGPQSLQQSMYHWVFNFSQALCDLQASINIMSLVVFKHLGLGAPKPKFMRLLIDILYKYSTFDACTKENIQVLEVFLLAMVGFGYILYDIVFWMIIV